MEKLTFTLKLHEACSDDELRPLLNCVHFIGGFAYATDGHMVVKQSLEYHTILNQEMLEGKSLHRDNYKAIMQFETAECKDNGVECKNSDGRTAYFDYFDRKGDVIPNFEAMITAKEVRPVSFIGITPELLIRLTKALHCPDGIVRLQFNGVDKVMRIDVPAIPNQVAVLMPALISENLFS